MKFCKLLLHILLFSFVQLNGQTSGISLTEKTLELPFDEITVNDGLSQGMVTCFLKDHSGFLWIGTKDGLNRYDGKEFKVLRHSESDRNSIPDNHITCLYQDKDDMLWIGTIKNGITRYNPKTGKFLKSDIAESINDRLRGKSIRTISMDPGGKIWVSTSKGFDFLSVISDGANSDETNYKVDHFKVNIPGAESNPFQILFWRFLSNGNMEIYSKNNIVTIENPSNPGSLLVKSVSIKSVTNFEDPYIFPAFGNTKPVTYYISANRITVVNSKSQQILNTVTVSTVLTNFPNPIIDESGNLWWSSEAGLCIYNLETKQISKIYSSDPQIEKSRFNEFYSSYLDANGVMWFGTYGYGILKYTNHKNKFKVISDFDKTKTSISGIFELSDNRILVQAYQINNPLILDINQLKFNKSEIAISNIEHNTNNCNSIVEDSNSLFIAYKHLFKFTKTGITKFPLAIDSGAQSGIIYNPLFVDKDNNLWCANGYPSGEKELFHLNKNDGSIISRYIFPGSDMHHEYRFVSAWLEDTEDNFWFGTLQGIYQFNKVSKKWKRFPLNDKNKYSTNRETVFSICLDPVQPDSFLWVGTNGFGLKKLNIKNGKVNSYNTKSGLPNNVIYGILPDFKNNLWLSSNQGISLFVPNQENVYNFGIADGLQSMEFNRYAYLKLKDGTLLFGGVNGINHFDPKIFYKTKVKANTFITNLKIYNENIEPGENFNDTPILQTPIEYTERIILPHDAQMITLTFAYLDMHAQEENQFQYKLEGLNNNWLLSGRSNEATYTNLSPGEYVFKVIGRKKTSAWGNMPATLQITVLPPWYSTLPFRLGLLFSLILIIYGIYRYNINQTIKIHNIRNKIASDLHDEIGSTLSSISLSSTIIQNKLFKNPDQSLELVKQIGTNTNDMMEAMSDIVWAINTKNDRFGDVINRMRAFTFEMLENLEINIHVDFPENIEETHLDMEQRKNLYLIYKESINNLAKYSSCKNVWINFSMSNHCLRMVIKDDGVGFATEKLNSPNTSKSLGGNGLSNMRKRAKEIGGKLSIVSIPGEGTTITMMFNV